MEKKVDLDFDGSKLVIKVDTNQDGEAAVEIKVDLGEMADEVKDKLFSKDEG